MMVRNVTLSFHYKDLFQIGMILCSFIWLDIFLVQENSSDQFTQKSNNLHCFSKKRSFDFLRRGNFKSFFQFGSIFKKMIQITVCKDFLAQIESNIPSEITLQMFCLLNPQTNACEPIQRQLAVILTD